MHIHKKRRPRFLRVHELCVWTPLLKKASQETYFPNFLLQKETRVPLPGSKIHATTQLQLEHPLAVRATRGRLRFTEVPR